MQLIPQPTKPPSTFRNINACFDFLGFEAAYVYPKHNGNPYGGCYNKRKPLKQRFEKYELQYELKRLFRQRVKAIQDDEELRLAIEAYKRGQHLLK